MSEKNELIRKQMHEILDIVLDGNGFEARSRDKTGTLPSLFIYFSGHVGTVDVNMNTDGYKLGQGTDVRFSFRYDELNSREKIAKLREAVNKALTDKKESEVLSRDITQAEEKLKEQHEAIKAMRKQLRKKMREESKNE